MQRYRKISYVVSFNLVIFISQRIFNISLFRKENRYYMNIIATKMKSWRKECEPSEPLPSSR